MDGQEPRGMPLAQKVKGESTPPRQIEFSRRQFLVLTAAALAAESGLGALLAACASAPPDRHSFRRIPDRLTDPNERMYWERFEFRADTTNGRITLNLTDAGRRAISPGTQINGEWVQWEPNLNDLYNAASLHADFDGFSIDYDRFAEGLIKKYGTPDPKHPEKETILMQKGNKYVLNPKSEFAIFELPGDCFRKKESGELPESAAQPAEPPPAVAVEPSAAPATPTAKQTAVSADQPTTAPESSVLNSIGEAVDAIPLPVKVVGGTAAALAAGYAIYGGPETRPRKARPRPAKTSPLRKEPSQSTETAKHIPEDQAAPQTERDRRLAYLNRLRAKVLAPDKPMLSGFPNLNRMSADADERNRRDLVNVTTDVLNQGLITQKEAETYLQDARYAPSTAPPSSPQNAFGEGVQRVIDRAFTAIGEEAATQVIKEGVISALEKSVEKRPSGTQGDTVDSEFRPEKPPS